MTNPTDIGQMLTSTLASYKNEITDNILDNHPLFTRLKAKGNIMKMSGGHSFQEKISYNTNGTIRSQGEFDTFDTTPQDVLTTATFNIKTIAGSITMSREEELKNSGKEQLINLMMAKINVLKTSMKNYMGSAIYGDGTGNGGLDIGGLQLLIADDPTTGTVGSINRANYPVWRNKVYDFSAESVTPSSTTIQQAFNTLWLRCQTQAMELPDLIACDNNYFSYFENSMQAVQRITDPSIGALGFSSYRYKNADVFFDPQCPSNHAYFLNTNHIFLKYLGADLFTMEEEQRPVNQLVYVTPMTSFCNFTIDNSKVHGVMHA